MGEMMLARLNEGQRAAFDAIMAAVCDVNKTLPRQNFLDGPGGTGKTFLYNTLIAVLKGQGKSVISVASTGIAATLLNDGTTTTLSSKFTRPSLRRQDRRSKKNRFNAHLIRNASLIISHEATMKNNHALDAMSQLFQTVMKNRTEPYGGKVVLLGGDFRRACPL